jgi:hypothetical protein
MRGRGLQKLTDSLKYLHAVSSLPEWMGQQLPELKRCGVTSATKFSKSYNATVGAIANDIKDKLLAFMKRKYIVVLIDDAPVLKGE